jgi:uncharacterized DUF497 family protein
MVEGKERYPALASLGRLLVVVATLRNDKIRVVTAFDAEKRLVELYFRNR